jgi:hypothetical protein
MQAGTFLSATVSLSRMKNRGLFVAALVVLFVLAACAFLRSYNAVALLTLNGSATTCYSSPRHHPNVLP